MTSLLRSLIAPPATAQRSLISIDDWAQMFAFGEYPLTLNQTLIQNREEIGGSFSGLVSGAYYANGIIFACIAARMKLLSEARFQFQQLRGGRPGDLFGNDSLAILERPEPGQTTADLLMRLSVDTDLAGNWFAARRPNRIRRMRPDWVTIIIGSPNPASDSSAWDIDAEVAGYIYHPGGRYSDADPQFFDRREVAHVTQMKDPLFPNRGMSWLTPIIRETMADSAATLHKLQFFERGATPSMIGTLDPTIPLEKAREWVEFFEQEHAGVRNAYKTMWLGGGAATTVVGSHLQQMDFKVTQGAGEVRIAAASGMHPVILGISEGLQGSSLNEGNFKAARRLVADKELRPLWRNIAGSLETIVPPPGGARLWYDDRDIPFLAEDIKDAAEVQAIHAKAMSSLIKDGWKADTVVDAVISGDYSRLRGNHTGLFSVQLQPPGPAQLPVASPAPTNGAAASAKVDGEVRCSKCHALLAERATPPYRFTCYKPGCKTVNETPNALTITEEISHG